MSLRSTAEISPGSWLGMFGGGQLGRMFTHVAQARGYHVAIFESEESCPAAQAADRYWCSAGSGEEQLGRVMQFAQSCQALTLEFENVPARWLQVAAQFAPTRPAADFLEVCQNRMREKTSLREAGFPVTPFAPVCSVADIVSAGEHLGWPVIIKTCQSGYDGKGQAVVTSAATADVAWSSLQTDDAIAEQRIEFVAEVSMLAARNARGQVVTYPLIENSHARHILDISRCPVRPELLPLETDAREIATGIAERFAVEGLFCVEFFVDARRGLLINEIAPRPHNSGHLTIEAFGVSQFEQQLRAVCNLPLAATHEIRPAAMANLLGDLWFSSEGPEMAATASPQPRVLHWEPVFATKGAYLHLYGKAQPRVARKMGHLTCLADSADEAVRRVKHLRNLLANMA